MTTLPRLLEYNEIYNLCRNGESRLQLHTKKEYSDEDLNYAYTSPDYDELLRDAGSAININYTPLRVAEWLFNPIPDSFWDDPDIYRKRFLDPFGDSGYVEKYLVRKLLNNEHMKRKFPDRAQRVYHILHNMLYSVAKTNASSLWLRKIVYYSSDATITGYDNKNYPAIFNGKLFTRGFDRDKTDNYQRTGNIKSPYIEKYDGENDLGRDDIFDYPLLDWIKDHKDSKDQSNILEYFALVFWNVFCNAEYKDIDGKRRARIMREIKNKLEGYFDVIIGNPPYNTNDSKTGAISGTVYNEFCLAAEALKPKYVSFIIPSKWAYGKAHISNDFPQGVLSDSHFCYLKLIDGNEAFPSVDTGEISIYSKDFTKDCEKFTLDDHGTITTHNSSKDITYEVDGKRWLKPRDSIIEKVIEKNIKSLADDSTAITLSSGVIYDKYGNDALSSSLAFKDDGGKEIIAPDGSKTRRPRFEYSLTKTEKFSTKYYITNVKLWKNNNGINERPNRDANQRAYYIYIDPSVIKKISYDISKECLVTVSYSDYTTQNLDYPYNAWIKAPGEISGSNTIIIGEHVNGHDSVVNLQKYIRTKFVTYIIARNLISQHFTTENLRFVPCMDFTQEWTDEKLNKFFDLTPEEIKRIDDCWNSMRNAPVDESADDDDAAESEAESDND